MFMEMTNLSFIPLLLSLLRLYPQSQPMTNISNSVKILSGREGRRALVLTFETFNHNLYSVQSYDSLTPKMIFNPQFINMAETKRCQ